jgi:hypothetical protein
MKVGWGPPSRVTIGLEPFYFLPDVIEREAFVHRVKYSGFMSRFECGSGEIGQMQRGPLADNLDSPAVVRGCYKKNFTH